MHPRYYNTGYRIWAADEDMSTTYTWTAQSFSGFFYDLEEDVSSETMTIYLDSKDDRSIEEGDLVYKSVPVSVEFDYDSWGRYNLTGFMAEKYFAAYTDKTNITDVDPENLLSHGYLSKILIDEGGESSEKHTITIGSTLTLKEGYMLKAVDVDAESATVLFVLLKDGEEVDTGEPVDAGEDYIYTKKIGSVRDVPIIIVHVENVFHGRETDAAFIRGVFQISENPLEIDTGDQYGIMEVKSKSSSGIRMENEDSFDLDEDSIVDIMGDIKFKVADDSDTLRFAPFVEGLEKLRGTVSRGDESFEWTPLNFEGLYYDFDTGLKSETLNATVDVDGRSIDEGKLVYKSVPVSVEFDYDSWGRYNLTGFMAEKYFAAYTDETEIEDVDPENLLSHGYLSKILIDEGGESSEKHTITIGSTLTLKEGYMLKAVDVDAESATVLFVLLKDGEEVDTGEPVDAGEDYIYTKKIGSVRDVPIIIVHVENVFHGRETDAAFIRGVFQISENPLEIDTGDEYGIMEVKSKSGGIRMENTEVVDLEAGDIIDVMGEIRFEVADDPDSLRWYPFIMVDLEAESASKLKIDAPETAIERDLITIRVTTGRDEPVPGADVEIDGEAIGTTDSNGEVTHTLTRVGTSTINATKVGYESASKTITVERYVETQIRIESDSEVLQTEEFELRVTVGGEPLSGASILVDNHSVGTTDTDGSFNYTFQTSGTHTVRAEKTGYLAAEKTINVIKPYSKFEATAFNITPVNVTMKEPVFITANITNRGNIRGEERVELKINGTSVDSRNITLEPGEEIRVNFTFVERESPGTYYAEILNKGGEFHVEKKPMGWLLYAGIATVIGLVLIYLVTMRPGRGEGGGSGGSGADRGRLGSKLSRLKMKIRR
ncbi:S-layer protein [Candidatus Methanoperedenaceae archaeon GB50]|nr:S-layer protein [Candidatus Methanoperedenaceae archaeon GB50]